ncbi:NAD(P)-dependent oxidoreductase [Streptomyces sp. NPDC003832]
MVCVLFPDPPDGYPPRYLRSSLPSLNGEAAAPAPRSVDFLPGELLGSVTGALGLRRFLEGQGHTLLTTSDATGPGLDDALVNADVLISQPAWPAALTRERIARSPLLRLVITAGSGAGSIDLDAARAHGVTVTEVAGSDIVSQAEHAVLRTLALIRNEPGLDPLRPTNLADRASHAYDVHGMHLGLADAGPAGRAAMQRLAAFTPHLHYTAPQPLPASLEQSLGAIHHPDLRTLAERCDVLLLLPPEPWTPRHRAGPHLLAAMPRGSYLINCGTADLVDAEAVTDALATGRLAGFSGALAASSPPANGPACLTDSYVAAATATLSAQARCAAGTREILEAWFAGNPIRTDYLLLPGSRMSPV